MITTQQLNRARLNAHQILDKLKEKYPTLRAYLVLCTRLGQMDMGASTCEILTSCPHYFMESDEKQKALDILKAIDKNGNPQADIERMLSNCSLAFDPNIQIEIRFDDLRFAMVWQLQQDELVDRERTPQSKGSIKIVLGTLLSLSETPS